MAARTSIGAVRWCLLLSCASALQLGSLHTCHRACAVSRRAQVPSAKILSRKMVDFTGFEPQHEFGLQGNILGLAPKANTGMLLLLSILVARTRKLPLLDLVFAFAFPAYLMLANALRFDANKETVAAAGDEEETKKFKPLLREGGRGKWYKRYVLSFAVVGMFLPLPFVFFAPPAIALAAAPHLFLVAVQSMVEGLTTHAGFAPLLRLAVPIGFNAYRLGTLYAWSAAALSTARASSGALFSACAWPALALALVNGAMWTYNLFVFLLLRVTPQYFDAKEFPLPATEWKWSLLPVIEREEDEVDFLVDVVIEEKADEQKD